ncbi:MAG: 4Fe-4S binding protein [Planctomycetia bacterium]|nr:4Fe-4S binding protein [Planctomycetia bacterium]
MGSRENVGKVVVDPAKCTFSGECFKVCPMDAISVKSGKAYIDQEKCDLDGACIPACPKQAIHYVEKCEGDS